jgi:hypothetical protein
VNARIKDINSSNTATWGLTTDLSKSMHTIIKKFGAEPEQTACKTFMLVQPQHRKKSPGIRRLLEIFF